MHHLSVKLRNPNVDRAVSSRCIPDERSHQPIIPFPLHHLALLGAPTAQLDARTDRLLNKQTAPTPLEEPQVPSGRIGLAPALSKKLPVPRLLCLYFAGDLGKHCTVQVRERYSKRSLDTARWVRMCTAKSALIQLRMAR